MIIIAGQLLYVFLRAFFVSTRVEACKVAGFRLSHCVPPLPLCLFCISRLSIWSCSDAALVLVASLDHFSSIFADEVTHFLPVRIGTELPYIHALWNKNHNEPSNSCHSLIVLVPVATLPLML